MHDAGMHDAEAPDAGVPGAVVTRRGVVLPKTPDVMAKVRRELTVAPFSPQNPFPKPFKVFVETPSEVVVPLHWFRKAFGARPTDARSPGEHASMRFDGQLREELRQPEAAEAVLGALRSTGGAMLCLATGLGKTATALYVACVLGRKTLVVVHKEFLAQQWVERISQFVPDATVSRVQGDTCDVSGDFVIAMLQTLVSRKYPPSVFEPVHMVIVDESHHIGAAAFCQAMFSLGAPCTLGLTATPERKDRLGRVVEWFLGDIAFRLKREHQADTQVRIRRYDSAAYLQPPPVNRRGDVCFTSVITALAEDAQRTAAVADEAAELVTAGRDVLVLSHRRAHCVAIAAALHSRGVECATYLGGDRAVPTTRVIVATYALTSEGFDCARLTGLVLATPASDVEQSCGRVMRGGATQSAVIVDVVDRWGVCYAQHAKRKAFYKRCGFKVVTAVENASGTIGADTSEGPAEAYGFVNDA